MSPEATSRLTRPAKKWLKAELERRGYELLADPFTHRLVRMARHLGIDTVIDGGANVGQFARGLRAAGFTGRILSVEPLSAPFTELAAASAQDPTWYAERAAFSDSEGDVRINVSANSVSSSALPMLAAHSDADPASVYVGVETTPAITLDTFVARHGVDPARTLLKLDVQGYEKLALAGAEATVGSFAAAQLELSYVPLYDGAWLADEVVAYLGERGYELWMFDPAAMHDPVSGRLLQCDGVFVRA